MQLCCFMKPVIYYHYLRSLFSLVSYDSLMYDANEVLTRPITRSLQSIIVSALESNHPRNTLFPALDGDDSLTPEEKMKRWQRDGSDTPDIPVERPDDWTETPEEQEDFLAVLYSSEARPFLIDSPAYQCLLQRIRSIVQLSSRKGSMLETLENDILGIVRAHTNAGEQSYATLHIEWDTIAFLREQYQGAELQQIGEVITLTGSGTEAQAATCAQYVNQTWPTTGEEVLRGFQAAINEHLTTSKNNKVYECNATLKYILF